ncbi:hypothetical protein ACFQ0M_11785 [Kitasatospora aburaviensis]
MIGSGYATSASSSISGLPATASNSSATTSFTRARRAWTLRLVNALPTRPRSRPWSGGSMESR